MQCLKYLQIKKYILLLAKMLLKYHWLLDGTLHIVTKDKWTSCGARTVTLQVFGTYSCLDLANGEFI